MFKVKRSQFTLIELVVVIVVLGILAAIVIPNIKSIKKDSVDAALLSDARAIETAVDLYSLDHNGAVPTVDGTPVKIGESNEEILLDLLKEYLKKDTQFKDVVFYLEPGGHVTFDGEYVENEGSNNEKPLEYPLLEADKNKIDFIMNNYFVTKSNKIFHQNSLSPIVDFNASHIPDRIETSKIDKFFRLNGLNFIITKAKEVYIGGSDNSNLTDQTLNGGSKVYTTYKKMDELSGFDNYFANSGFATRFYMFNNKDKNKVYMLGDKAFDGDLSTTTTSNAKSYDLSEINIPSEIKIKEIYQNTKGLVLLSTDKKLYALGKQSAGELGLGSSSSEKEFQFVPNSEGAVKVIPLINGYYVIKEDGTVWHTGKHTYKIKTKPVSNGTNYNLIDVGYSDVVDIYAEYDQEYSVVKKKDGKLYVPYIEPDTDAGQVYNFNDITKITDTTGLSVGDLVELPNSQNLDFYALKYTSLLFKHRTTGDIYIYGSNAGELQSANTGMMNVSAYARTHGLTTTLKDVHFFAGSRGNIYLLDTEGDMFYRKTSVSSSKFTKIEYIFDK